MILIFFQFWYTFLESLGVLVFYNCGNFLVLNYWFFIFFIFYFYGSENTDVNPVVTGKHLLCKQTYIIHWEHKTLED